MKVAILSYICSEKSGSRAPIELAKSLSQKNQVVFYALAKNKSKNAVSDLKNNQVKIRLINKKRVIPTCLSLIKYLKQEKPDLIISNTTLPLLLAAKLTRIPIVMNYYGTQFNVISERIYQNKNLSILLLDKLVNILILAKTFLTLMLVRNIVTISNYCADELTKIYHKKPLKVIYLGTASNTLRPGNRIIAKNYKQPVTLLSVSRITPYKGFDLLIKMANSINSKGVKIQLIMAGSLNSKSYLKYLKELAGGHQIIINPPDNKLRKLYQTADIYVTCDKYLFFGMPILEAASFGIPTVCLNYAACQEVVIDNKTGFIANDINEMQKKVTRLIENSKLRRQLSKNAREHAQAFNWKNTAKEYQKIIDTYK